MKLASYRCNGKTSCGIVEEDTIIDIPSGRRERCGSVLEILQNRPQSVESLEKIRKEKNNRIALNDVELLAPVLHPGKLLALAGNYPMHLSEFTGKDRADGQFRRTTTPWPFLMPQNTLTGHNAVIPWPAYSRQIDYEIELAVVIGKNAKAVSAEQAKEHIAGFTIANDISARSVTYKAGRKDRPRDEFYDWLAGKWADGFLPTGPYLVTADQIEDPQNLSMTLKVNGHIRQQSSTARMIYNVCEIVSFFSHIMTLQPGDIICTGTPHGVALADGRYLQAGDTIECTIEKIGTLRNTLGPQPNTFYEPLAKG